MQALWPLTTPLVTVPRRFARDDDNDWWNPLDELIMETLLPQLGFSEGSGPMNAAQITLFASIAFRHMFKRLRGRRVISWDFGYPAMALLGEAPIVLATTGSEIMGLGETEASYNSMVNRLLGETTEARW